MTDKKTIKKYAISELPSNIVSVSSADSRSSVRVPVAVPVTEKPSFSVAITATPPTPTPTAATDTASYSASIFGTDETSETIVPYIVSTPRANSKLILQNMEEVLNSVKKKHRLKHRRKREQKRLARMEAMAVAVATGMAPEQSTPDDSVELLDYNSIKHKKHDKKHKKPLQEKSAHDDNAIDNVATKRPDRRSASSKTVKANGDNFSVPQYKAKAKGKSRGKDQHADHEKMVDIEVEVVMKQNKRHATPDKISGKTKATNAFEVMMNARNRSIGGNSPGRELEAVSPTAVGDDESVGAPSNQRKQLLHEWNERKGASKRKLDEESRSAYVERQLENRAKRFKQMLIGRTRAGGPANESGTSEQQASVSAKPKRANRTRGRRSRSRSPSIESLHSISGDEEEPRLPDESSDFAAKLSSPTAAKKRNSSLFGYFPKMDTPKEAHTKVQCRAQQVIEATKVRGESPGATATPAKCTRSTTAKELAASSMPNEGDTGKIGTQRGRPRRSCAVALSPPATTTTPTAISSTTVKKKSNRKSKPASAANEPSAHTATMNEESIEVISLDDSGQSVAQQTPKKLAPLFTRGVPKPNLDPEAVKARQQFLQSGVPEKLRLARAKRKKYRQAQEEAASRLLPCVGHIQQLDKGELAYLTCRRELGTPLRPPQSSQLGASSSMTAETQRKHGKMGKVAMFSTLAQLIGCSCKEVCAQKLTPMRLQFNELLLVRPPLENKRDVIKEWKMQFERFPTYKCYNQMREKYRFFSAIDANNDTQQMTESVVVTRQSRRSNDTIKKFDPEAEEERPPPSAPNGELLFSEKYKPLHFEQVLVNLTPITQLRDFLANWCNSSGSGSGNGSGSGSASANSRHMQPSMDNSSDYYEESNSNSQTQSSGNVVVLIGPVSTGKTSAVFALAHDMNFNVLEVNAGMRRTGKKLIQELQEATQSHQVRKQASHKGFPRNTLNGRQSLSSSGSTSSSSGAAAESSVEPEATRSHRKSLILIEDADIVFDQTDAGFVDSIYTLAASSKRPVIVVASDPHCPHLQRLMNQKTIQFTTPNAVNIAKFLAVLSLIENCPVNLDDLISLYLYNRKDLRKTLHELQFFIQSGGDRERSTVALAKCPSKLKSDALRKRTTSTTAIAKSANQTQRKSSQFYASPTKRHPSEEPERERDENLDVKSSVQLPAAKCNRVASRTHNNTTNANDNHHDGDGDGDGVGNGNGVGNMLADSHSIYMHRTLFEFYTRDQNEKYRIPYPIDFKLLHINLFDIMQVSHRLNDSPAGQSTTTATGTSSTTIVGTPAISKRKSRSPKKHWLSSASNSLTPLESVCGFYENISVAALVDARDRNCVREMNDWYSKDKLRSHLSEEIAHNLVEEAIEVNLAADFCPYNLFNTPPERSYVTHLLNNYPTAFRSSRALNLDYEPALRSICRSERRRSTMERRSIRFYHYLRSSAANMCNFSSTSFDVACSIFQEAPPKK